MPSTDCPNCDGIGYTADASGQRVICPVSTGLEPNSWKSMPATSRLRAEPAWRRWLRRLTRSGQESGWMTPRSAMNRPRGDRQLIGR